VQRYASGCNGLLFDRSRAFWCRSMRKVTIQKASPMFPTLNRHVLCWLLETESLWREADKRTCAHQSLVVRAFAYTSRYRYVETIFGIETQFETCRCPFLFLSLSLSLSLSLCLSASASVTHSPIAETLEATADTAAEVRDVIRDTLRLESPEFLSTAKT
jgi:hypothetical protein